jgi:hypothetical protein
VRHWWLFVVVLLLYWATRLPALDVLPLHNDEGLHLTRAVEVWNLHPFWEIRDGKIINHWLIAAFYPQNAPVFVGRFATVLVGFVGLAAAFTLARRHFGLYPALFASVAWITSPYLFFYERLAFSDAEAGAIAVVAVLAALRLARTSRQRDAVLTGLALATAMLFKFTAAPFAVSVALIVLLLSRASLSHRLLQLATIGVVVAASFAVPLGYLALRGRDFFGIALGWISTGSAGDEATGPVANLIRLQEQLGGYGLPLWSAFMGVGLLLLVFRGRRGLVLVGALLLPLAAMILLGTQVLSRHYVVVLPLALTLGGIGIGTLVSRSRLPWRRILALVAVQATLFVMFAMLAYDEPEHLPLPPGDRSQMITDHSGGYGLREAVQDFPLTITEPDLPIVASMFPDSCRRANFYADQLQMICTDAPATTLIETLLAERGAVYVLVDSAGLIGLDVRTLDATAEQIAAYRRPGDSRDQPSVVLWRLQAAK